jgi:zinc protease
MYRAVRLALALALSTVSTGSAAQRPAGPEAQAVPQPADVLPFRATERTLPNGLRVIVVPTGFPNLVSIDIPVQTGSRNEVEPGKSGFAHFFEHLMFRGTPKTPPEQYRQIMSRAGARDNAGTGDDRTHYYATFAKEDLETVLAVYADMFQNLAYSESDFKTEARAILGEYNKNSADPLEKLFEVQRDRYYQAHTYKHTTMGFIKDIENMPNEYAYSKLFFQRWYRPQYTTLIVAGDVTPEQVMPIVDKYWSGWKPGTAPPITIPKEPPPSGPKYVHVPWPTETLPWVTVGFLGPAFDETSKDSAAMEMLAALYFGQTSDLYKQLVVTEQKVDQLEVDVPASVDPSLFTVLARVKHPADAAYVRDRILATVQRARTETIGAARLRDAKSYDRYSFARSIDSTERVASVVSSYASYRRSYATVNARYRTLDSLTPADLQLAGRRYFTDRSLIVATLSNVPLSPEIEKAPAIDSFAGPTSPGGSGGPSVETCGDCPPPTAPKPIDLPQVVQQSPLPQIDFKLLFTVGSANDPPGKEGLAALTATMLTAAGSKRLTIEQIDAALYPTAGSFRARTDKEMTTLTGAIHKDNWAAFIDTVIPQLTDPGWRQEDFERLRTRQLNALVQDLRSSNEEELGKERLQTNIFHGTPYGHVALGTVAGLKAITLDDVRQFARQMFTRANLTLGINGDVSDRMLSDLRTRLAALPEGTAAPRVTVPEPMPAAISVEILKKDTRATAISLGFPIDVTRKDPDFVALSVARSWLGEHRFASGRLYQRIREERGINYGDYAYIEAFPRGMFQFFPDPNIARSRQIFEIWIRPVVPVNAHMTLRIALSELDHLVADGLSRDDFERTRDYLMKNVYVMTARQDQQLGYALDSRWYGIPEFTSYMRDGLQKLTLDQVNAAIKRHLGAKNLSIVVVTQDADDLKQQLVSDAFSPIQYDGQKSKELLAEDKVIGAMKLNIPAANVTVTPIEEVFAK